MSPAQALDGLDAAAAALRTRRILDLFAEDPGRLARLRLEACGLVFDHSKQRVDQAALAALAALAEARGFAQRRAEMAAGAPINTTENRAVLHMALRGPSLARDPATGAEAAPLVAAQRARIAAFAADFAAGRLCAASGRPLDQVLHLGIGGSDLGPRLVFDALKAQRRQAARLRFAANIDGADIAEAIEDLDPERTLVVVVSKTFTTQETTANAGAARAWLAAAVGPEAAGAQFCAVTAAPARAEAAGISPERVFPFWDWVGGRYSLWSAVGLSLALSLQPGVLEALNAGAAAMDAHFMDAPPTENAPMVSAFIQVLNRRLYPAHSTATVPYARRLQLLPAFLQQLEMESNGKGVDRDGAPLKTAAASITWGDVGANAQHSFFQLLHQGLDVIPLEFVLAERMGEGPSEFAPLLHANALAQAQALLVGKTRETALAELLAKGLSPGHAEAIAPHRVFSGDRPSSIISLPEISPEALGALIAFYEHRTFVQGVLEGVNSFDQWGVELGKELAQRLAGPLSAAAPIPDGLDPSTDYWVRRLRRKT